MFLKVALIISVLIYAIWGIFQGAYVFPSRYFNNPNIVDDITQVYYIFFALLSLVVFMILSTAKNIGHTKYFDIVGSIFLLISIVLFVIGF